MLLQKITSQNSNIKQKSTSGKCCLSTLTHLSMRHHWCRVLRSSLVSCQCGTWHTHQVVMESGHCTNVGANGLWFPVDASQVLPHSPMTHYPPEGIKEKLELRSELRLLLPFWFPSVAALSYVWRNLLTNWRRFQSKNIGVYFEQYLSNA